MLIAASRIWYRATNGIRMAKDIIRFKRRAPY